MVAPGKSATEETDKINHEIYNTMLTKGQGIRRGKKNRVLANMYKMRGKTNTCLIEYRIKKIIS